MVSSRQIRAARALLGWSAKVLSEKSGVGSATIKRYEVQEGIPSANTAVLMSIKACFESAGIEFIGDPLNSPGVMLHVRKN
jgi:transcriptional regulator with XRE-family HTH domain